MPDPLDFLDEPKGSNAEPTPPPEPVVETPPPQSATPDPQATPPAPAAAPEPASVPPGHVPLEALLDTREKLKAHQAELAEYKRKYEEATRKPAEPIDPLVDPDAWQKQIETQRQRDREDVRFEVTKMFAVNKHGEEVVKAAEDWLTEEIKSGRIAFQNISNQPDPYDHLVKLHKRHQIQSQIGDDPDEFVKRRAAELGFVLPSQPVPETQTAPRGPDGKFVAAAPSPQPAPLPKPSLASAPAASGNTPKIPTGPGSAFDAVFK